MLFLTQRAPGHSDLGPSMHVDLIEANRRQLLAAGLKAKSIQVVGGCTQCHGDLFLLAPGIARTRRAHDGGDRNRWKAPKRQGLIGSANYGIGMDALTQLRLEADRVLNRLRKLGDGGDSPLYDALEASPGFTRSRSSFDGLK